MSTLLNPRAVARIKAAFDTCELVAKTVRARRHRVSRPQPKPAPARGTVVYERGALRVVERT